MVKLVIRIDHQGRVEAARREFQVRDRPEMGADITDAAAGGLPGQEIEHLGLDIDRHDLALREQGREAEGIIPRACADVGDHGVRRQFEERDGLGGRFLFLTCRALKPTDAGMAHHL